VVTARPLIAAMLLAMCAACTQSTNGPAPRASASTAARPTVPSASPTAATSTSSSAVARASSAPRATTSAPPPIPPVSARARAAGLIDVRTVVPDALVDLRYATSDNFVHVRLYPKNARCLVHTSMARGLRTAAHALRSAGYLIVFWDCYRPHPVQVHMFRIVPDPNWVARPGPYATSHEAGRSVDVTLARRASTPGCPAARIVQHHCLLAMGTGFDDFTPRAYAYATDGVSARARSNRALLRNAMGRGGLSVYSGEWWHFDGPGALVQRPILHAPLS
jgi:zinc D-Ala-D-Ala dipeptidase